MKEELIGFKTAKLAKEKGFKELCSDAFAEINMMIHSEISLLTIDPPFGKKSNLEELVYNNRLQKIILRPTQSFLQRWLREEHNIHIMIYHYSDNLYHLMIEKDNKMCINHYDTKGYNTYEESIEKGLFKALKLI
jgi:hypothetical protein